MLAVRVATPTEVNFLLIIVRKIPLVSIMTMVDSCYTSLDARIERSGVLRCTAALGKSMYVLQLTKINLSLKFNPSATDKKKTNEFLDCQ